MEAFGGVGVDGGFGLGEVEGVGPGVVVEGVEPVEAGDEAVSMASGMLERMPVRIPARWSVAPRRTWGG